MTVAKYLICKTSGCPNPSPKGTRRYCDDCMSSVLAQRKERKKDRDREWFASRSPCGPTGCLVKRCSGIHLGDEAWHGSINGFNHHKCRCERCCAARLSYGSYEDTQRRWRTLHRVERVERNNKWRADNPERYRELVLEAQHRRRARKAGGQVVKYNRTAIFERDDWMCWLCERPIERTLRFPHPFCATIDHVLPICQGGADSPDNVRAAHFRCNQRRPRLTSERPFASIGE